MNSVSAPQLTLNFEPALPDRFPTLREYISYRMNMQSKSAKQIAADLDIAPSTLSRKLNPRPEDNQRFNVEDLEGYLASTGDAPAIIEYLASKYMGGGDEARKARAVARVEALTTELQRALETIRGAT